LRRENDIGGTFNYRSYENAELVSSKQLTAFSDHRFPLESPDHITLTQYVEYLRSYVKKFVFGAHIKLGNRVTSISPNPVGEKWKYTVKYSAKTGGNKVFLCSHIAICTGLHVEPNIPSIPGIEHITGDVFHSSKYKLRSQLSGRDVLILGCGETAMDISYEAIKGGAKTVTMCFRTGFLSFPKALSRFQVFGRTFKGGLPIDGLITNLFETAYVHHAVAKSRLRWFVSDFVIKRVLWFLTGTQAGMNQHVGELPKERLGRAYVFLNKSTKAMPYLNRPWKGEGNWFLNAIGNRYIDLPKDAQSKKWVDTCTFPQRINEEGRVIFEVSENRKDWRRMQNKEVKPDCVVYCTGLVSPRLAPKILLIYSKATNKHLPISIPPSQPQTMPQSATSFPQPTPRLPLLASSDLASEQSLRSQNSKQCGGHPSSSRACPSHLRHRTTISSPPRPPGSSTASITQPTCPPSPKTSAAPPLYSTYGIYMDGESS
jgi:dimethylaniline monooxygenase (N-oxide forming)